ncbi:universal stress protein, partial [Mycobacterium sp. CBMA361]|nr:universal stress protein [Mycolicibacterium sp. CBMA 361]
MNTPRIAVAYLATPGGNDAVAVGEQIAHTLGAEIDLCMVLPSERPALAAIPGNVLLREAEGWLAAAAAGVRNDIAVTTHLSFDESST